jgi:hypothetical protein
VLDALGAGFLGLPEQVDMANVSAAGTRAATMSGLKL